MENNNIKKLSTYDNYKPSGIEWIDNIPSHWFIKRVKNIGKLETSSVNKKIEEDEKLVKIVNFVDVFNDIKKELLNDIDYMVVSAKPQQIIGSNVKVGDLLITPSSEDMEEIGYSSVVKKEHTNTLFSYHLLRLSFYEEMNIDFKKYLFNSNYFLKSLSKVSKGTTRKILGLPVINSAKVLIPSLLEQKTISKFLDKKTSLIDKKLEILKERKKLILELEKSVINQVVTKGLQSFDLDMNGGKIDFNNDKGLSDSDFNTYMNECGYKDSGIEWIDNIPTHWDITKFKNIVTQSYTGTTPSKKHNYYDGNVKWMTISDLKDKFLSKNNRNISKEFLDVFPQKETKKGDLIFSFKLTLGKVAIADAIFITNEALLTIPKSNKYSINYLYYSMPIFIVKNAIENIYGAGLLNQSLINDAIHFCPSLPEQKAISLFLDKKTTQFKKQVLNIDKEIELLEEFRKTTINEVVTGKIKVVK